MSKPPDFTSRTWLREHIAETWAFYHPRGFDEAGGFYQFFSNEGEILDRSTRNLVCSSRYVVNQAHLYRLTGMEQFKAAALHGARFLHEKHRNAATGGYRWQFQVRGAPTTADSDDNVTYGIVFVVLAYAHAIMAGIDEAREWLNEVVDTLEQHLWSPNAGLYADKASADWSRVDPYRGQNCNMHACEAMLAAFEATGEKRYLDRADIIARRVTVDLARANPRNLVWEHYDENWVPDMEYNRDIHTDSYRPWGYLSGHQTEWAKLLLILRRHRPEPWQLPRAQFLFDETMHWAWDDRLGGMFYSCAPDRAIYDTAKHQWTHAETVAAAALLALETEETRYWIIYNSLWDFIWSHLVDHRHGAWFRMLDGDNALASSEKSAPEPDYHNIGACVEVLLALQGRVAAEH
ncbi:AGE family epimerase/isomerase [Paraburkholderia sp. DHOC27]|uniref:AGE family epimerase/isomerase n=1 Tax=Paraburkholderia sp. DHOC27 TaxID=2303330 RepID=UPI000E3CD5F8|nr:AGE family epimerase/isomerase [Paraburkholderia sp. DHOC27]RFU48349.1 AGE family epimerase/isomerase [Paraburkholderia sp. DHOC27]